MKRKMNAILALILAVMMIVPSAVTVSAETLDKLEVTVSGALDKDADTISGEEVFKLYDTFGFPIDLTREIAEESHLRIDEDTFNALMKQQKTRAREARANISGWSDSSKSLISGLPQTEFTGYTDYRSTAKILAILTEDGAVDSISEGDCTIVLDRTPFYGEGGGQIGDEGTLYAEGKLLTVYDTKKTDGVYIHLCTIATGTFSVGDEVMADIDDMRRRAIARNHSAAHLLQAALRKVLGDHVEQAGSYVSNTVCRFDFTHFSALSPKEIDAVEKLVNAHILAALAIDTVETDIETAKQNGAMALFGEKYGSVVRMVKMGDFSTELCGGTHCHNSGEIGLFKIISETSVAAGVRRIEAVTGRGVLELIAEKDSLLTDAAKALKAQNVHDITMRAAQLQEELKAAHHEIDALNAKMASLRVGELLDSAAAVGSTRLITARFDGMNADGARTISDTIKAKADDAVIVIAIVNDGKLNFIAGCGKDAVAAGAHAGKLASAAAAVTGGKGGGRPDNAMSGGKDIAKVSEALDAVKGELEGMLK